MHKAHRHQLSAVSWTPRAKSTTPVTQAARDTGAFQAAIELVGLRFFSGEATRAELGPVRHLSGDPGSATLLAVDIPPLTANAYVSFGGALVFSAMYVGLLCVYM